MDLIRPAPLPLSAPIEPARLDRREGAGGKPRRHKIDLDLRRARPAPTRGDRNQYARVRAKLMMVNVAAFGDAAEFEIGLLRHAFYGAAEGGAGTLGAVIEKRNAGSVHGRSPIHVAKPGWAQLERRVP